MLLRRLGVLAVVLNAWSAPVTAALASWVRLVTDGGIKRGRYVSGVYDLVVGQGAP